MKNKLLEKLKQLKQSWGPSPLLASVSSSCASTSQSQRHQPNSPTCVSLTPPTVTVAGVRSAFLRLNLPLRMKATAQTRMDQLSEVFTQHHHTSLSSSPAPGKSWSYPCQRKVRWHALMTTASTIMKCFVRLVMPAAQPALIQIFLVEFLLTRQEAQETLLSTQFMNASHQSQLLP